MGLLTSAASVLVLCAFGTGLTLYAVHVQRSRLEDASYRALCDLDETITCSEILAKDQDFVELLQWWSDRVGVAYNPNLNPHLPTFRVAFFPLLCLLGCVPLVVTSFLATAVSSICSLVAAYLLYMQFYVHNQICLPCTASYFLHLTLFVVLSLRWSQFGSSSTGSQSPQQAGKGGQKSSSKRRNNRSKKSNGGSDKERSSSDEGNSKKEQKANKTGTEGKGSNGQAKKRKK